MTVTILRRLLKLMILCSVTASIVEAGLLAYSQWLTVEQDTRMEDEEDDDFCIFCGGVPFDDEEDDDDDGEDYDDAGDTAKG